MSEKYWMSEEFTASTGKLQDPSYNQPYDPEFFRNQPHCSRDAIPEWWWIDADEAELRLNVHQAYFDITDSARIGGPRSLLRPEFADESRFTPMSSRDSPQWASFVLKHDDIFKPLNDATSIETFHELDIVSVELNSMTNAVGEYRFATQEPTTQLIGTYAGNMALGGYLSVAAINYIKTGIQNAGETQEFREGTKVLQSIRERAFGDESGMCGFGITSDGRFISNTGSVVGTGSIEVMPDEIDESGERGYRYSSHNLDSSFTGLWAFSGLAKLIGDAHRFYIKESEQ